MSPRSKILNNKSSACILTLSRVMIMSRFHLLFFDLYETCIDGKYVQVGYGSAELLNALKLV